VTETRTIDADLLIIGGGSAGCMAAIRAMEIDPKLKVVIFEKGDIKYSGSIARGMDALNVVVIPDLTSPELYVESITSSCQGVADTAPSYEMARRSYGMLKKLEGWGVRFPKDKDGQYRTLKYHVKGRFQTAMEEPDLKVMISRMAQEKGALAINRVMGLRLLQNDGRAAGAVGLNVRTGELVACRAGAVILTAGGQARFSLPNSGYLYGTFDYPGNSGDGYAMAFRAGASVTGMEYTDRSILIKDANMPLLAITVTRGGRVMDICNNIIMENECHSLGEMDRAVQEGRGPLRIKLSHLRPELIDEIEGILFSTERPVQERFFQGRGINFRKRDIELWPTECQLCGGHGISGVYVDEKAQSDVPGLFAAGDVAAVPKQHLTGAFVFGEVAAEQAVAFISREAKTRFDDGGIRACVEERNGRFASAGRDIDVRDLEYKVRRMIGDYVISPKNEYKLDRWMEWAGRFRREIEDQIAVGNAHDLAKLYEVENIVECGCLSARAALERRESRWGDAHHRTDFPDRDDRNFLCHMVLKRGPDPAEIVVTRKPVLAPDHKEAGR
jgi:succinate dehydrogenase/fumarate reductase flavoprotein subunit